MSEKQTKKAMTVALALATELTGMVLVGIFGGQYLGGLLDHPTAGMIIGCVLGFAVWTLRLIQTKRYIL